MTLDDIQQIAVIGAGLMGHGIAQEFAFAGYEVHLHDVSREKVEAGIERIRGNLQMFVDNDLAQPNQIDETLSRIHGSDSLDAVGRDADFVVEAVLENLPLKQEIFRQLDEICPAHAILASNTTALMPSQVGSLARRKDGILNTHYFNPPYLIPLVELIRSPQTSDETLQVAYDLMVKIGKTPAIIQKEAPGFVGPRLQAALIREAFSIVERGIASAEDVDLVVRNSFGRRLSVAGPFQVFELAGWDLVLAAFEDLYKDLNSSTDVNPLLREMVAKEELGVKSGKGFYEWTPEAIEGMRARMNRALIGRMKED
ncbi:MAG: 3-hydroxyacyl-CoA dehydrogenase family protein [Candidatus Poribacteria bacterium]|nr:3-hydroxyacyl-CoA dehydrogenase family protein [Candidatus Poribacteria bacterium]